MQTYELLEVKLGEWLGVHPGNVVVCSSGTAALHLALESFELYNPWSKSQVLVPDYCMIACPRACSLGSLYPITCKCDKERLLIDPSDIREVCKRCEEPCVVMPVHTYGRRCDVKSINEAAYDRDLCIIEDMAEGHGIPLNGSADATCYSFYKNKIIAGEEGGCVVYSERRFADRARQLRTLGFTSAHNYSHIPRGHNYRLANCLAEKILDSLALFNENSGKRREIESYYDTYCEDDWKMGFRDAVWVYDIRISGLSYSQQNKIVNGLNQKGIQARHGFKPISVQPEYAKRGNYVCQESLKASSEVIYLPVSLDISRHDADRTFGIIRSILGELNFR